MNDPQQHWCSVCGRNVSQLHLDQAHRDRRIEVHAPPDALVQFTIYDHPKDFPRGFLVRAWFIIPGELEPVPGPVVWPARTLEGARAMIPHGMVRLQRLEDDDPVIAEVWT